jgi:hypothetical protein
VRHGGTGRDLIRLLVGHGVAERGWKRLWIPSYLCQEVVGSFVGTGTPCRLYPDRPDPGPQHTAAAALLPADELRAGDAVVLVNHFGVRTRPDGPRAGLPEDVDLIEDHTHDPWSSWARTSDADFCLASLRKTLPIPDGAVLWSPLEHGLPVQPPATLRRELASSLKLAAMMLKALYLEGRPIEKRSFRRLALRGEEEIAKGSISGVCEATQQLIAAFPAEPWRETRRRNHAWLVDRLADTPGLRVLQPAADGLDRSPFSFVVQVPDTPTRQQVLGSLVESGVYPAVLWPLAEAHLPGVEVADERFAGQMLSIHCDGRYSLDDLETVASSLLAAIPT